AHHHGHEHEHGHHHGHQHAHQHARHHDHAHAQGGPQAHEDLNLKSAYVHVLADAATSVLAIAALIGGWIWGWSWLDPAMGVVGAVLVAVWAKGLLVQTGKVLLDREMDAPVVAEIREAVELAGDPHETRIIDLHVWRVGKTLYSCALTVLTHDGTLGPDDIRRRLAVHEEIVHSTIEIQRCPDAAAPHDA
ncbi:MAG: cation transporter, partial [Burkholderiaceae bacterium]